MYSYRTKRRMDYGGYTESSLCDFEHCGAIFVFLKGGVAFHNQRKKPTSFFIPIGEWLLMAKHRCIQSQIRLDVLMRFYDYAESFFEKLTDRQIDGMYYSKLTDMAQMTISSYTKKAT